MQSLILSRDDQRVCHQTGLTFGEFGNNIMVTNSNFAYMVALNANLSQQIAQLNSQMAELKTNITTTNGNITQNTTQIGEVKIDIGQLHENVNNLNQTLASNMSRLEQSEIKIIELVKKVGTLLSYMPQFVQDTTSYFVRLVTGIKMGNVDELPTITYDTHLLLDV